MNLFKRLVAFSLALVLTAGLLPVHALAAEQEAGDYLFRMVNPLYADILTDADFAPVPQRRAQTYAAANYADTVAEAAEVLRPLMKDREEAPVIYIYADSVEQEDIEALFSEIFNTAVMHTGVPTEGDYLAWQWGGVSGSYQAIPADGKYEVTLYYSITYYTTAEEEQAVDNAVRKLLADLNLNGKTDYEKVKAVYDYICANVDYDHKHVNDDSYKHQFTAYAALIDGTAVCQGYSLLLYRLLLELGIDSRLISGIGNGGPHGWNIIGLDDLYYNADSTWDEGRTNYSYFLKCEKNFPDHTRDKKFTTDAFNAAYPMATKDYEPPVHTHTYTSVVTPPTCTSQGYTTYTCACGNTYQDHFVNATEHDWGEGVVTKEPTEEEAGIRTYTCEDCGGTKTESIDKLGHTHRFTSTKVEPNCTEQGVTTYTCACGYSETAYVDPLGHDYAEVVTPPTCLEGGYTTFTCSRCDHTYVGNETEATGHQYQAVVTDPTCTEEGYTTYTCVCGDTYTDDETDPTGHDYATRVVAPTCTEEGYTTYICIRCNDTYDADPVPATGHSYNAVVTAPTCTEQGYTTYTCACGDTTITSYVDPLGHTEAVDKGREATCTEAGLTEGKHCSVCEVVLVEQEEIPALGHSFGNWVTEGNLQQRICDRCGYTENKVTTDGGNVEITAPEQSGLEFDVTYVEPEDDQYILVEKAISKAEKEDDKILKVFDITLKNAGGVHVQPDGTVKVKLPLDQNQDGNYKVYRVNDDGSLTDMAATRQGSHMVFETDHFSLYVIVEEVDAVQRIAGASRADTALEVADALKEALGVEKFDAVIITNGEDKNFADALTGSYLATVKKAPILMYRTSGLSEATFAYIQENLKVGGTVYLLGGKLAIPESVENALSAYTVKRLSGGSRFDTNLAILREAGITDEELLIARGYEFADSLSASATGLPILLVNEITGELTDTQITCLETLKNNKITILGGTLAISEELEAKIEAIVGHDVDRVYGTRREDTSVEIAKRYFPESDFAVVAYSRKCPDGLCGGPLAYAKKAPLLLTNAGAEDAANGYVTANGIDSGYVLGGTLVVSDKTAREVFGLSDDAVIEVK